MPEETTKKVKPANKETVEHQSKRKLVRVDTVSVPVMVSGKDMRKKYKEKQG